MAGAVSAEPDACRRDLKHAIEQKVSSRGGIQVARQRIQVAFAHACQTVTVELEQTTLPVIDRAAAPALAGSHLDGRQACWSSPLVKSLHHQRLLPPSLHAGEVRRLPRASTGAQTPVAAVTTMLRDGSRERLRSASRQGSQRIRAGWERVAMTDGQPATIT